MNRARHMFAPIDCIDFGFFAICTNLHRSRHSAAESIAGFPIGARIAPKLVGDKVSIGNVTEPRIGAEDSRYSLAQPAAGATWPLSAADIEHIAEEIESMGKAEKRELVSRLAVLLTNLLTWQFQPTGQCTS